MPTSKLRDPRSKSETDSNQNSEPVAYTFSPIFDAASKIANDVNEEERLAKQNAQNLENLENSQMLVKSSGEKIYYHLHLEVQENDSEKTLKLLSYWLDKHSEVKIRINPQIPK